MYFVLNENENLRINCSQYIERVTKESYKLSIITSSNNIEDFESIVDLDSITSIEFFDEDGISLYKTTRYTEIDDCVKSINAEDPVDNVYLSFEILR